MPNKLSRRKFVLAGSGIALVGLGGYAAADSHEDDDDEMDDDEMDDDEMDDDEMDDDEMDDDEMDDDEMDDEDDDDLEDDDMEDGDARVRVAHLSPDAPNVDVSVDGDAVLEDVPYGAVSDYLELAPGTYEVTIAAAGDPDTVAFEGDVEVPEGDYTIAAIGELSEENQPFEPLVLEDDNSPVEDGMSRVRVVHASPDAPAVDVTVGRTDTVLFENVSFGESGYTEVPEGSYLLCVRTTDREDEGDYVAGFDVDLAGGTVYTGFAAGYAAPEDAPADEPFDLIVAVDAET